MAAVISQRQSSLRSNGQRFERTRATRKRAHETTIASHFSSSPPSAFSSLSSSASTRIDASVCDYSTARRLPQTRIPPLRGPSIRPIFDRTQVRFGQPSAVSNPADATMAASPLPRRFTWTIAGPRRTYQPTAVATVVRRRSAMHGDRACLAPPEQRPIPVR